MPQTMPLMWYLSTLALFLLISGTVNNLHSGFSFSMISVNAKKTSKLTKW